MKKFIPYILTLMAGLAIGALIWSGGGDTTVAHDHEHEDGTVYTCSMHPQIRQNEPGLCPLCGMALTPIADSGDDGDPVVFEMTENAIRLANVRTVKIGMAQGDVPGIRLNAKIALNNSGNTRQTAHIPGRIERFYIQYEGQAVQKGQIIATVYSPELIKAQEELKLAQKYKVNQPEIYEASLKKLRQWRLSEKQITQIENSTEALRNFDLYADQGGIVSARMMNEGNYAMVGDVLYELSNFSTVWLLADAYEKDLKSLKISDELEFELNAYPGEVFKAKIDFIEPSVNPESRTAGIRATLPNPGFKLKPEMIGTARHISGERTTGTQIQVPKSAVLWTGTRSIVYVKQPDTKVPSFALREVVLGGASGDSYEVLDGLEIGEEVVIEGTFSIDAAAQLMGKASMMNPAHTLIGGNSNESEMEQIDIPDLKNLSKPTSKNAMSNLVASYLKLKDALVATDPQNAQKASLEFAKKIENTKLSDDEKVLEFWTMAATILKDKNSQISESSDVAKQRDAFIGLSNTLIALVKGIGIAGETLYIQNCPMANNDKGADWLAIESEIKNPYFGNLMMACGTVDEQINP
jgi:membrane fusion protein, copper/silver efflux system